MSQPVTPSVQRVVPINADGTPVNDPAAPKIDDPDDPEATVIGLLRGILAELKAQTALMDA